MNLNFRFYYNGQPCTQREAFTHWLDACEIQGEEPENAAIAWRLALSPRSFAQAEAASRLSRVFITFDSTVNWNSPLSSQGDPQSLEPVKSLIILPPGVIGRMVDKTGD